MVWPLEMVPDLDLDEDHYLSFTRWAPDDLPNNRRWLGLKRGEMPVVERWGAIIRHYRADGTLCEGSIEFEGEWQRRIYDIYCEGILRKGVKPPMRIAWVVGSWEPLDLSPSILCCAPVFDEGGKTIGSCGDHGYIRQGKWVRA